MALFQKSVQNDYLNRVQDSSIKEYWEYYDSYFNNPEQQKLIEQQKERKFYSEFIDELFVNCLGYTKKIGESQNYFIEEKNETDSGKADGAVKVNGEVVAVMEFKDTTTKNLKDVESQAFGYKNTHPKCNYIVTCNFKELWFYIDNTTSKEPFNLFNLSYDGFKLLWLCLSYESISKNLPEQIKNKSVTEEEGITKKLYSDYSLFRNEIFNDLVDKNPQFNKLLLFKKTQKLLDRFLFIFFAEDRLLLPTNSIAKIIKKWEDDIAFGEEKSLYTTFVFYFNLLNKGRPASKEREEIFAYNGGLFAPDEILDSIVIDDELLSKHTKKLSSYDFISDVSVNILGHIFEHSLSQIEEIQNEIAGIETDKSKSKRKKDGVFYTPAYITKYIVENTVGKLCKEKRKELEFDEAEFAKDRKGRQKNTLKKLSNQLDNYREWLLGITICDPACGSGAFLVEALNFLIDEHKYIDELRASLFGESIQFSDITANILENNLYGVDINEESVEIAKLSLWLRTAQKGRKLTSLSDNLKCGNSLIDDPEVAGDKAFNWENEFPRVFGNGGFDVVIGNPPYVNIASIESDNERAFLQYNYKTVKNKSDLYSIFVEKGKDLLKIKTAILSYIIPNSWLGTDSFSRFREMLINETKVTELIKLPSGVFNDAVVTTLIITLVKEKVEDNNIYLKEYAHKEFCHLNHFLSYKTIKMINSLTFSFHKNIELNTEEILGNYVDFSLGIKTSNDKRFISFNEFEKDSYPILRGRNISKYYYDKPDEYIWYRPDLMREKKGAGPRNKELFEGDKIFIQDISKDICASFCDENIMVNDTINFIYKIKKEVSFKFILALLNSKLINFWFSRTYPEGLHIKINQLKNIPLKLVDSLKIKDFDNLVNEVINATKRFHTSKNNFLKYLQSQLHIDKLSKKIQNWNELEFSEFIKELNKAIKKAGGEKLSKMDEMEWMEVFETNKSEAQTLKAEIDKTDKEIDTMVYELYGLTEDEIEIVENATK